MSRWQRKVRKTIFTNLLTVLPRGTRDRLVRSQVKLDYSPPPNLVFRLARTKDELEQAYRLLYRAYVASGSMKPSPTEMRITPYHALPSTSVLIAVLDGRVVATLSVFRVNPLGLPITKAFDVSRFAQSGLRYAEISSLCVDDSYKSDARTLLFGLLKYLYEYVTRYFGVDVKLIVIKPFRRHFYESMLLFERLDRRIVTNYAFSNGATVMAEYLDLRTAPERYREAYQNAPDERNLHKYFTELTLPNFEFPERLHHKISDPVMTPELLDYFFREKSGILLNMSEAELNVLRNLYVNEDFRKVLGSGSPYSANAISRSEVRGEVRCQSVLSKAVRGGSLSLIAQIHNISRGGLMIHSQHPLDVGGRYHATLEIGQGKRSEIEFQIQWKADSGFHGCRILKSDAGWDEFVSDAIALASPQASSTDSELIVSPSRPIRVA